ncbi:MAG: 30S ribosomal protein S5 [Candidatus Paceibacterota bacterium]|jgi:small subunit ribosomal protein S5
MNNTKFERRRPKEVVKDEFDSKLLDLARVTKVTGGGKTMRFRAVMIVGNKTGKVGVGVSKGLDVSQAIEKATKVAKKNLKDIPIANGTIPFEVEAKLGPSNVILKPQKKGKGLVAGGTIRVICSLAGIEDISSKSISRTKNKLNNARATMKALSKLNKK